MRVTRIDCFDSEGRMKPFDRWFFYGAFFVQSKSSLLVKLGISTKPIQRCQTLVTGCPFPLQYLVTDRVGGRSEAARIEVECQRVMADRRVRGEWYAFDPTREGDGASFKAGVRAAFLAVLERAPKWTTLRAAQVTAADRRFLGRHEVA